MAIADDLRKTLTDPTPLYFAAGTADIAVEQAKRVPGLIEQLRAEAPGRIDAVRNADPKAVQDKVAGQAKEAQARVTEAFGSFDTDLKKLGESAQDLALRSVGMAAEYAVRARETYEKVAERGEGAVKAWRGEAAEEITEIAVAVEPEPAPKPESKSEPKPESKSEPKAASKSGPAAPKPSEVKPATAASEAKKPAARKTTPRKTTPRKNTPPPAK